MIVAVEAARQGVTVGEDAVSGLKDKRAFPQYAASKWQTPRPPCFGREVRALFCYVGRCGPFSVGRCVR